LAKHAVSKEDREVTTKAETLEGTGVADPMHGLEELDMAGPKPE
jgi:hypothetical protein